MKKHIKSIFPVMLSFAMVFSLAACKKNEPTQPAVSAVDLDYEAFTVGSSLSAAGVEYTVEKDIYNLDKKTDSSLPQTATLTLNGKTITATYSHSEKVFPDNFHRHIYYGKNTTYKLCFDDSGKLVTLFWRENSDELETETTKDLTAEECLEIAKDFILNTVSDKVNLDEYTVNRVQGTSQIYMFEFKKYIDGFATADKTRIGVYKDGTVTIYNSTMFGRISAEDMPKLDQDKIKQTVEKKLDSIYKETKDNFAAVRYGEPTFYVTILEDGKPAVYCEVSIRFEDGNGGSFGEMVSMIIT